MNPIALGGLRALGEVAGPSRYAAQPFSPVGSERALPGFPYGMRGMPPGLGQGAYPPAPVPQGVPAQSYWSLPPFFTHTYGYKDALAAAGLEFHTEVFDLSVDPIASSGANMAAGATVIAVVRVSQEADFVCEKFMEFCVDTADQADPDDVGYRVQIFDNATNRALSNIPIPRSIIAGTGQRPALIKPRLFRRNSDISFVFTADSQNANAINRLVFTMRGYKVFDPNALNLNNPQ
jgi:hypothetical protein